MSRTFLLRNQDGDFFAGFKADTHVNFFVRPAWVRPRSGNGVQAMLIDEEDLQQTIDDLKLQEAQVERVQVG